MVAGGVTFAIPGAVPEAAAQRTNDNLYVSAENSAFDNVFSGFNVVEVVVRDPDINFRGDRDDEPSAEPRVEVDGDQLRMVQGNDGNWYAYFAAANVMDADTNDGNGLDYGIYCSSDDLNNDRVTVTGSAYVEAVIRDDFASTGVFLNGTLAYNIPNTDCDGTNNMKQQNVIRTPKYASNVVPDGANIGSVNLGAEAMWPFIQVYSFDDETDIVVEYQKGGDAQSVTLYYDSDPDEYGTGLELGRDRYPLGGGVIMTMTDLAMNVDPTNEDTWTFDTTGNQAAYYYIFNDDGELQYLGTPRTDDDLNDAVDRNLQGIDDNLYLTITRNAENAEVDAVEILEEKNGNQNHNRDRTDSYTVADMNHIVTFIETGSNTGMFTNTDSDSDTPNVVVSWNAKRGTSAIVDHNDSTMSVVVGNAFATIEIDSNAVGGVWNSGEEVPVTLTDPDVNRKAMNDEDLNVNDPDIGIIPSVRIGSPITLANGILDVDKRMINFTTNGQNYTLAPVDKFSDIARITPSVTGNTVTFMGVTTGEDLKTFLKDDMTTKPAAFQFLNIDARSVEMPEKNKNNMVRYATLQWTNSTGYQVSAVIPGIGNTTKDLVDITSLPVSMIPDESSVDIMLALSKPLVAGITYPMIVDFFSFGQMGDGVSPGDRINNAIYRLELEESGDNTGVFEGTMEFVMLNQLNVRNPDTYANIDPISDGIVMIVHNDMTDEDSIRINYLDLGADGVATQVADQIEAPTTSGSVSFNSNNYKVADTVTVTLEDADLNTAVDTIDIYTVVNFVYDVRNSSITREASANDIKTAWEDHPRSRISPDGSELQIMKENRPQEVETTPFIRDNAYDQVGKAGYGYNTAGENFGRVLDITFDDKLWLNGCGISGDNGLGSTGFTLIETGSDTGVFTGDFQVPLQYCHRSGNSAEARSTTGVDMEVNYVDYRDSSGETIEVGDSAGIRASTGTVSLDRTVYPVPFGEPKDFVGQNLRGASIFPIHATGIFNDRLESGTFIPNGDLMIHVRINDPDFDVSASGEDKIAVNIPRGMQNAQTPADELKHGPLKITISRGAESVIVATAGGESANDGRITTLGGAGVSSLVDGRIVTEVFRDVQPGITREVGPITEIAPDAGIFELDLALRYTDGPEGSQCPQTSAFTPLGGRDGTSANTRFTDNVNRHCIQQGDILTVEYTDPTDASGNPNTVTDSATFDLRNGVLQSDKSVYIIGGDMILTLIEPDLNLESDEAETYDLDLIEWDSDAAALTMGNRGGGGAFDPEPSDLRETGDSTGIFQVVVEIPEELAGDRIERGEAIELEYIDYGPSGADYVGGDTEDVNLNIFTSNFGATIEMDQKVYTWTDKVYITIVAPDHNFDSDLVDEIGETGDDPIKVSTRGAKLEQYRLVETGTDTGIFAGEVILTGFTHDADGDTRTGDNGFDVVDTDASGTGPTDGKLPTSDDDGITVSFEFSEDETVLATALVRWNIGEVQWIETSYPAQGTGIVRVIDPDMNLDPESVDNFDVDVYSDSDSGGIDLTVTETNEATGVFEGNGLLHYHGRVVRAPPPRGRGRHHHGRVHRRNATEPVQHQRRH